MSSIPTPPDLTTTLPAPPNDHTSIPSAFAQISPAPEILAQGAEGILFKSFFLHPSRPCAIKYRPVKTWRHPTLDQRLTRHRILSEARTLVKCRRDGISVPAVLALDWEGTDVEGQPGRKGGGWMMVEWVQGATVRSSIDGWLKPYKGTAPGEKEKVKTEYASELVELMAKIGREIGKMHTKGVIHGDLTTSNIMLRSGTKVLSNGQAAGSEQTKPALDGQVVLIDFGLAVQSSQDEDRAVDLYVLERAFGSTHPNTEDLFDELLKAYGQTSKGAKVVLKRLDEVRMRGRKKSMIG